MTEPRRHPNRRQTSDATAAERDARIWELRKQGFSLRAIGRDVGLSAERVRQLLERGYQQLVYPQVEQVRALELERLDEMLRRAWAILDASHATVSHGRLVTDDEGNTVPDTGPVLAAIDRVLRIGAQRAKLLGLEAPTRVHAEGTLRYVIDGVDLDQLR